MQKVLKAKDIPEIKDYLMLLNKDFDITKAKRPNNILGLADALLSYIALSLDFKITLRSCNEISYDSKQEYKKLLALLIIERLQEGAQNANNNVKTFMEKPFKYIKYKMEQKLNCTIELIENDNTESREVIFIKYSQAFKNCKKLSKQLSLPINLPFNSYSDYEFLYLQLIKEMNDYYTKEKKSSYRTYLESYKMYNPNKTKKNKIKIIENKSMVSVISQSSSIRSKLLKRKTFTEKIAFFAIKYLFTVRSKNIFRNYEKSKNSIYAQKRIDFAASVLANLQNNQFCSQINSKDLLQIQFKILIGSLDIGELQLHTTFSEKFVSYITKKFNIFPNELPPLDQEKTNGVIKALKSFVNEMDSSKNKVQKTWNDRIETLEKSLKKFYTTIEDKKDFRK